MKLSSFNYHLPKELISQKPTKPRDHSRLLVLDKKTGKIIHQRFYNLNEFLKAGDVLVLNDTKVFPARILGKKKGTGGKVEILLIRPTGQKTWEALVGSRRVKIDTELEFGKGLVGKITDHQNSVFKIKFNLEGERFLKAIHALGKTPTPPYIKKYPKGEATLRKDYQTTFARVQKERSVAAPTAGFHFTKRLLHKLKKKGIQIEYITLHVGYGTFQPVKTKKIEKHRMHPERIEINKTTAKRLNKAKKEGKRVIAVGTTVTRALEASATKSGSQYRLKPQNHYINIFIYPGYKFKFTDALITNFHLPKTSLLMLVSAFATLPQIKIAYREAIKKKYRFYSFGDGMLIVGKK